MTTFDSDTTSPSYQAQQKSRKRKTHAPGIQGEIVIISTKAITAICEQVNLVILMFPRLVKNPSK